MALLTNDETQWTFTDDQLNKLENIYRYKISGSIPLKMVAQIRQLTRDLEAARAERDLAIAHDRQPYPTAEAYEAVCAALDKHKHDLADCAEVIARTTLGDLKRENERLTEALREALIHLEFYGDERNYDGSPRLSAAGGRPWVNHVGAERAAKAADEVREALAANRAPAATSDS